ALLAQHAAGLGAGVVELGGLADHDRAGADHQDTGQVVAAGHQASFPEGAVAVASGSAIRARARSTRSAASCGPAAASGWYCTEKAGRSRHCSPSTTLSFRPTWETSTRPYRPPSCGAVEAWPIGASAAKPWLCAVTSTFPVVTSC